MQEIKCPPSTSTARWGLCQEGYGEDPYLQAELGAPDCGRLRGSGRKEGRERGVGGKEWREGALHRSV